MNRSTCIKGLRHRGRPLPGATVLVFLLLTGIGTGHSSPAESGYDPLAEARRSGETLDNPEAPVPPQCYTRTDGKANPCWTCHTLGRGQNYLDDSGLQVEYDFSEPALENHWTNLFVDRSKEIAAISDAEILRYVREDNYTPLMKNLSARKDYPGWVPDLDLARGFDREGFARDGSGWRAFRYKPFLGTFWPTNGSTDDVIIRLPEPFRRDAQGNPSKETYKVNLAILEAAMTVPPKDVASTGPRPIEPVDEALAGTDLDGNGKTGGLITSLGPLPKFYAGGASGIGVQRFLYPEGTEFLHTVRYIDPDAATLLSTRLKELRYSVKFRELSPDSLQNAYRGDDEEADDGALPSFIGSPTTGFVNDFGWRLQGFIEDADGRLRAQTKEEHYFCMGCHSAIGVTVDQSFAFPRKLPGGEGWAHQDLTGIPDAPQAGHTEPEYLVYFRRTLGGDEFRENREILERYFPGGKLEEAEVARAAPGGDRDITDLIVPSRGRALLLNKAYLALVREQSFQYGRDAVITPAQNVHRKIVDISTGLKDNGRVYRDGVLWLDWR